MNLIEFLKTGDNLNGVSFDTPYSQLVKVKGEPSDIQVFDDYKYVFYGPFRYGIQGELIVEMAVEFKRIVKPIIFENVEYTKCGHSIFENFKIDAKVKMHRVIGFINHLQLEWGSKNHSDKDYLIINIKDGPDIIFYLYDGTVDKISIMKKDI